ncbi:MAG: aconitate hydratase, partial [Nitrospirae bacterium]
MDPNALTQLTVNGETYDIHALESLSRTYPQVDGLPRSLKVLLENLLRHEDGVTVTAEDVRALATWDPDKPVSHEIAFRPARILMQDFTGVPAICDLAAMRDAIVEQWHRPGDRINPLQPAELVIDHSVQVDVFGQPDALERNTELEFARNRERYAFLRWAQQAFRNLVIIPPDTGIVHQVNLEYLARVVMQETRDGRTVAFPDTLLGTDSHTTMVNGLGVLGWGVGGIEAEAAMLGQPVSMLIPEVTGVRLTGTLPEGTTATDLVLTITQRLRQHGVVGHFVEFFGEGIGHLTLADRATVANMAPEYGATCSFFPVDEETIAYLRLTGRAPAHVALVEAYAKAQGLWHDLSGPALRYSSLLEIDLGAIEPSLAGPRRPQDRVALKDAAADLCTELESLVGPAEHPYDEQVVESFPASDPPTAAGTEHRGLADPRAGHPHPSLIRRRPRKPVPVELDGQTVVLDHGSVVIAAITSCTNTSNPSVLMAAGLL